MILLLIIGYFVLEGYSLSFAWREYGAGNTFFALFLSAVIGIGILRNQGRNMIVKMQGTMARGQAPTDELLHGIFIFASGLLFLIPGFFSDVLALILLLPGTRHLVHWMFKRQIAKRLKNGNFRVFTYGSAGGGAWTRESGFKSESTRDVTPKVIDVTPISVESREVDDSEKPPRK